MARKAKPVDGQIRSSLKIGWKEEHEDGDRAIARFIKYGLIQPAGATQAKVTYCLVIDPTDVVIWPIDARPSLLLTGRFVEAIRWIQRQDREVRSDEDRTDLVREATEACGVRYHSIRAKVYAPKTDPGGKLLPIGKRAEQLGILFSTKVDEVNTWVLSWPGLEMCDLKPRTNGEIRNPRQGMELVRVVESFSLEGLSTRDLLKIHRALGGVQENIAGILATKTTVR